jgi:hypothetical protein
VRDGIARHLGVLGLVDRVLAGVAKNEGHSPPFLPLD